MRVRLILLSGLLGVSVAAPAFAKTTINLQCMQTAIEKRESSYITTFDNYYASTRSAMIIYKDTVKNAWGIADKDQRKTTIKNAKKNFSTTEKAIRRTRRDLEKQAKKTFKAEEDACEVRS